jgi:hypothetical protein
VVVTFDLVLLLLALVAFVLAAVGVPARVNWIGLGLALTTLAAIV